jgi:hypothetical protein
MLKRGVLQTPARGGADLRKRVGRFVQSVSFRLRHRNDAVCACVLFSTFFTTKQLNLRNDPQSLESVFLLSDAE